MTQLMFGPLVLFAASVSAISPATTPAPEGASGPSPKVTATAHAIVSIRIVSGVRFGPDEPAGAAGADRRKAVLATADGTAYPAELLEFQ